MLWFKSHKALLHFASMIWPVIVEIITALPKILGLGFKVLDLVSRV